jgi:peptide deformylase
MFDLPRSGCSPRDVVAKWTRHWTRVEKVHHFAKGVGLAAPQVGIGGPPRWSVRPPDRGRFVLLNPRVVAQSTERV